MQRFQDIRVWQRSHALTLKVYELTRRFPRFERFGLVTQLRRAASSVPTNIAEGSKRVHAREYSHFLNIAEGSIAETEYLLILSRDLRLISDEDAASMVQEASEIAQMLFSLREKVQQGASLLREDGELD